jgi:hypothetical protein
VKVSDESPAGTPRNGTDTGAAPPGASGASEERVGNKTDGGLIDSLLGFVESTFASANGLIEVQADRVRLSVRRTIVNVAIVAATALCAVLWLGAAALAALHGLCGGFTALWGGREWLGDLCGGLFALLLAAGVFALCLKLTTRREILRLEAKYERIRNKSASAG